MAESVLRQERRQVKRRGRIDRQIMLLLISTLVTVTVWVGFEVYQSYVNTQLPDGIDRHLGVWQPELKIKVLDELQKRNP